MQERDRDILSQLSSVLQATAVLGECLSLGCVLVRPEVGSCFWFLWATHVVLRGVGWQGELDIAVRRSGCIRFGDQAV